MGSRGLSPTQRGYGVVILLATTSAIEANARFMRVYRNGNRLIGIHFEAATSQA
jgi:hypothetical protein